MNASSRTMMSTNHGQDWTLNGATSRIWFLILNYNDTSNQTAQTQVFQAHKHGRYSSAFLLFLSWITPLQPTPHALISKPGHSRESLPARPLDYLDACRHSHWHMSVHFTLQTEARYLLCCGVEDGATEI
jgi:hypothetical protein